MAAVVDRLWVDLRHATDDVFANDLRMIRMKSKRQKERKAWIAILSFSLVVFILLDCSLVYSAVIGWVEPRRMIFPALLFTWCTWGVYQALRSRMLSPRD